MRDDTESRHERTQHSEEACICGSIKIFKDGLCLGCFQESRDDGLKD